jgi:hypothetical protein
MLYATPAVRAPVVTVGVIVTVVASWVATMPNWVALTMLTLRKPWLMYSVPRISTGRPRKASVVVIRRLRP